MAYPESCDVGELLNKEINFLPSIAFLGSLWDWGSGFALI